MVRLPPELDNVRQRALAMRVAEETGRAQATALADRAQAEAYEGIGMDAEASAARRRLHVGEEVAGRLLSVLEAMCGGPEQVPPPPKLHDRVAAIADKIADEDTRRAILAHAAGMTSAPSTEARYASASYLARTLRAVPAVPAASSLLGEIEAERAKLRAGLPDLADCLRTLAEIAAALPQPPAEDVEPEVPPGTDENRVVEVRAQVKGIWAAQRAALAGLDRARSKIAEAERVAGAGTSPDAEVRELAARELDEASAELQRLTYPSGRPAALASALLGHLARLTADTRLG